MTDPGIVAALGIEAVEWLDEAGDRVSVRISGRWRRRPTSPGQPWLVVESAGERHRFPAMPEPPGLTGMMPGTWRMSFRVPTTVARSADVRAWLQLGAVLVPLPSEPAPAGPAEPSAAEPGSAASSSAVEPSSAEPIPPMLEPRSVGVFELQEASREEQLRETERALDAERARTTAAEAAAADLAARLAELGDELERSDTDVTRLTTTLAGRDRSLRGARQRAHAEEMVRHELARERDHLDRMLKASRVRLRELEDEVTALQRRADEAEHRAAAARRASPSSSSSSSSSSPPPAPVRPRSRRRARLYAAECGHAQAARIAGADVAAAPPAPRRVLARPVWSVRERELVALRMRRAMRPQRQDLAAALDTLRGELADLRAHAERERQARSAAEALSERLRHELDEQEARSAGAFTALDELRDQIEWVRRAYLALGDTADVTPGAEMSAEPAPQAAPEPGAPGAPRNGDFEPDRVDAARTRLREQTPAPDDVTDEPPQPELVTDTRPPFTLAPIAKRDPEAAGKLLLRLLPAQGIVHPAALAYDLVLDPATCVRVTVADGGATKVSWMHTSRPRADVRFQLEGDPASIIRLLTAGALRRRLRWRRLARLHGDRSGLSALGGLVIARLSTAELDGVGVGRGELDLHAGANGDARGG